MYTLINVTPEGGTIILTLAHSCLGPGLSQIFLFFTFSMPSFFQYSHDRLNIVFFLSSILVDLHLSNANLILLGLPPQQSSIRCMCLSLIFKQFFYLVTVPGTTQQQYLCGCLSLL